MSVPVVSFLMMVVVPHDHRRLWWWSDEVEGLLDALGKCGTLGDLLSGRWWAVPTHNYALRGVQQFLAGVLAFEITEEGERHRLGTEQLLREGDDVVVGHGIDARRHFLR